MNTNGCHPPSPSALAACGKQIHVGQVQSAWQERKSTGMGGQGGLGHKEHQGSLLEAQRRGSLIPAQVQRGCLLASGWTSLLESPNTTQSP